MSANPTWKEGDKVEVWRDERLLHRGTVVGIAGVSPDNLVVSVRCDDEANAYYTLGHIYGWYSHRLKPVAAKEENCTCTSAVLWSTGCCCGWIEKERAARLSPA